MHKVFLAFPKNPRRDAGIALVIILFCITLLAMMVLAFVSGARTELASSTQYSTGAQAQQLAASALNVAMGQLAEATDLKWASDPTTVAWASQPGMIRTYDDTGTPLKFYKLYSSDEMIFNGSSISTKTDLATYLDKERPGTWNTKPAVFTDLNEPSVRMVNGTAALYFPIADPRAAAALIPNIKINNVVQSVVPGFSFTTLAGSQPLGGAKKPSNVNDATARLPMPVKWLYVLKDGTTKAPTSTDGLTATVPGASKTNPIVGRIAFWMDDDCNKVNINTASEGSFWDVPVAQNLWEFNNLDVNWPLQGEFQRFPGHPATTSLSAVFPTLKSPYSDTSPASNNPYAIPLIPAEKSDYFYDMTPRIRQWGSMEGTYNTQNSTTSIPVSGDRLYDSVDELLYSPFDSPPPIPAPTPAFPDATPPPRKPGRLQRSYLTSQDISLRRFFLTAHSRAPETNLFNQPRVAIWPFDNDKQNRNATELLMAQASTAGVKVDGVYDNEFFFTRNTPANYANISDPTNGALSPTIDFEDAVRNGRNKSIYSYLRTLTSQNIPGFGGNFAAKWGSNERDQILTEIFDFIRAGINSRTDLNPAAKGYTPNGTANYGYRGVVYPTVPQSGVGAGTRGFGRFVTLGEASLVIGSMYCGYETHKDANGQPTNLNPAGAVPPAFPLAPNKTGPPFPVDPSGRYTLTSRTDPVTGDYIAENDMWPALLLEMFLPSPGVKICDVNVAMRVDGLNSFTWTGFTGPNLSPSGASPAMWSVADKTKTFYLASNTDGTAYLGGLMLSRLGAFVLYKSDHLRTTLSGMHFPWTNPQGDLVTTYGTIPKSFPFFPPLSTSPYFDPASDTQNWYAWKYWEQMSPQGFQFKGGTIDVTITPMEVASSGPGNPSWAQHFSITFPPFTMKQNPIPQVQLRAGNPLTTQWWYDMNARCNGGHNGDNSLSQALVAVTSTQIVNVIPDRDIVRSMVLRSSDNRLLAVRQNSISDGTTAVTNDFVPHKYYMDTADGASSVFSAHTLSWGAYSYLGGSGQPDYTFPFPQPAPPTKWLSLGNLVSGGMLNVTDPLAATVINPLATNVGGDIRTTYSLQNASNLNPKVRNGTSAVMAGDSSYPYNGRPGDWDTGPGGCPDGPYINKPDEGFDANVGVGVPWSYLNSNATTAMKTVPVFFSPSRQIASPVRFGSLPTGVLGNHPWQTLLFCPNPAAGWATKTEHPGYGLPVNGPPFTTPPDYLLLDLFWMPVTEPWAISDGFSTAGKINLNYRMFPFDYITRTTGLRAVFANTFITAISDYTFSVWSYPSRGVYGAYKASEYGTKISPSDGGAPREPYAFTRYPINPDATLLQFDEKFNGTGPDGRGPDVFRAAAQICEEFLVPGTPPGTEDTTLAPGVFPTTKFNNPTFALNATRASFAAGSGGTYNDSCFWQDKRLTGDNMRERPYDFIYPRITTRSNVYTVHVRAQALQQTASTLNSAADTFTEGKDKMNGEYRVSYEIERYLDPNLTTYNAGQALGPYKLRVINQRTVDW